MTHKPLLALVLILTLSACSTTPKAKHIVWIGLDGWGSYSVEKAEMPTTKQLMAEGSYTVKKRTVLPSSSSVNWASMFMGAGPELHGWQDCCSEAVQLEPRTVNENGLFPNIFNLYRKADPNAEIGVIYDWDGIKFISDTLSLSYFAQGPDYEVEPHALTEMAVNYIKEKKPNLFVVVYDNPDYVGHMIGHDTPEYYETMTRLDTYVAEIIQATKDAGIYDDTIFVVTSDHGGIGTGHGSISMQEMETPFIIAGKGIKKGYCFDDISMMQFDCASVLAEILGIEEPEIWISRSMPVFE